MRPGWWGVSGVLFSWEAAGGEAVAPLKGHNYERFSEFVSIIE